MKIRNVTRLTVITVIAVAIMFAGCIEERSQDSDGDGWTDNQENSNTQSTVDKPDVEDATVGDSTAEKYGTVTIYKDGQTEEVQCSHLNVFSDKNTIFITNDNVEGILVSGHHNEVSYPGAADPEIINTGDHNTFEILSVGYTPAATPTVEETVVKETYEKITVWKDGQWLDGIKCSSLLVSGNDNTIRIDNDNVEKIIITGHYNGVSYPKNSNPIVRDLGNYNYITTY